MKYVDLDATIGAVAGVLSANAYLERLSDLAADLPAGARAFATDREHYDFHGRRCVKDLKLADIHVGPVGENWMEARFRHNCWKHDDDLTIRYRGVHRFTVDAQRPPYGSQLGEVILDEVLPHNSGCSHEVAFHFGCMTVVCDDLTATWIEADCPEKPAVSPGPDTSSAVVPGGSAPENPAP